MNDNLIDSITFGKDIEGLLTSLLEYTPYKTTSTFDLEIIKQDTHYLIICELPGVLKEDIDLEIGDRFLTIKATKKQLVEKSIYSDIQYGVFTRKIDLNRYKIDDVSKLSAKFENGLLKITLPIIKQTTQSNKIIIE